MDELRLWLAAHHQLLWWGVGLSAAVLVVSLIALPWIVYRLPVTYFADPTQRGARVVGRGPIAHWLVEGGKTLVGALLVVMGLALLVLPGQGLLLIIAGLFLMSFPGKYRLERWLVMRRPVWRGIQWLRQTMRRPRLVI